VEVGDGATGRDGSAGDVIGRTLLIHPAHTDRQKSLKSRRNLPTETASETTRHRT